MPENPFTADEEQFEHFIDAMGAAFEDVDIPDGAIDGENILDGSIRPDKLDLSANWEFRGRVSAPNLKSLRGRASTAGSLVAGSLAGLNPFLLSTLWVYNDHVLGQSPIVLVDASKKIITVRFPLSSISVNHIYMIKRVDDVAGSDVLLETIGDDKLDKQTRISIPERGCLICVSSGVGWHILANYS